MANMSNDRQHHRIFNIRFDARSQSQHFAVDDEIDSLCTRAQVSKSQLCKRAASAAFGILALTGGVTAAMSPATGNGFNLNAGRLAITLASHDEYKLHSCSTDTVNTIVESNDTDDDNFLAVFAANSTSGENGLPNPFVYDTRTVALSDFHDGFDYLAFIYENAPIELIVINDNQNK